MHKSGVWRGDHARMWPLLLGECWAFFDCLGALTLRDVCTTSRLLNKCWAFIDLANAIVLHADALACTRANDLVAGKPIGCASREIDLGLWFTNYDIFNFLIATRAHSCLACLIGLDGSYIHDEYVLARWVLDRLVGSSLTRRSGSRICVWRSDSSTWCSRTILLRDHCRMLTKATDGLTHLTVASVLNPLILALFLKDLSKRITWVGWLLFHLKASK